ncbi:MFS transporter [Aureibacillus halotolerans]|uniref:Transmembrane secretion effector n=1 Tax=Aureibacillus halotolerans TaxID=1508390 RepID=A0A4R6U2Y6_9BACI|nr:MFS transporter [Aureibacillus halotolerans]TDQ40730.1 transmembrane secretion effector [Aureibacillus halotolerans]
MGLNINKKTTSGGSRYRRIFQNSPLMWLWGAQSIATIGDTFFNLSVMWVIYQQSGSALQTALVGVVWHVSDIIFGPIAGVYADRWSRKKIMVVTNFLLAIVVAIFAVVIYAMGYLSPVVTYVAVFVINCLTSFMRPARSAIMPSIIGKELLITAQGFFSTVQQGIALLANAAAGIVIAFTGVVWAIAGNAFTFFGAALCILAAKLPAQAKAVAPPSGKPMRLALFKELGDGWRVISERPLIKSMVWINLLINVVTFTGPLYPVLVSEQLDAGPAAYGIIQAAGVVGAMLAGILCGVIERRFGAGKILAFGWFFASLALIGMAFSTSVSVTAVLQGVLMLSVIIGNISMGAVEVALIPEDFRGRVVGVISAISVLAIPFSTFIGGLLADIVGVVPLFVTAGIWVFGIACYSSLNPHIRNARITEE